MRIGGSSLDYFRLDAVDGAQRLPFVSLKVLLENLLRTEDGEERHRRPDPAIGGWDADAEPDTEIQFTPARVVMQDFTGVPAVVDLATMREAVVDLGGDAGEDQPARAGRAGHRPLGDRRLFGTPDAFARNVELEYERNRSATSSCAGARPPSTSSRSSRPAPASCTRSTSSTSRASCSQPRRRLLAYPDTLVGTDSHTTMVNGLGVLGWGVGGIEAEAAMLGQPVSMLIPRVVGFKLTASCRTAPPPRTSC